VEAVRKREGRSSTPRGEEEPGRPKKKGKGKGVYSSLGKAAVRVQREDLVFLQFFFGLWKKEGEVPEDPTSGTIQRKRSAGALSFSSFWETKIKGGGRGRENPRALTTPEKIGGGIPPKTSP